MDKEKKVIIQLSLWMWILEEINRPADVCLLLLCSDIILGVLDMIVDIIYKITFKGKGAHSHIKILVVLMFVKF